MSSPVHYPITLGQDWIRVEQVWNPPRLQRTVDCDAIADPKPPKQPPWKGTLKVDGASSQSESIRSNVDESRNQEFAARKLLPDAAHVVKLPQRNPIVQGHEQHDKTLQPQQRKLNGAVHEAQDYTALFPSRTGLARGL